MQRYYLLVIMAIATALGLQAQTPITTLTDFQSCLNGTLSGYTVSGYTTCPLASGTYTIDGGSSPTLNIGVSNITVEGSSMSPSVLQRANSSVVVSLMTMSGSLTNVTIQDLTFDGNRSGVLTYLGSSTYCPIANPGYYDLNLANSDSSIVTAQYLIFINAPGAGLVLDGMASGDSASTVSYSNWATGGASTAGRATGMFLNGTSTGAYYNTIMYQGTAAINVYSGSYEIVYGNDLSWNRYEMPDGAGGGQIYTNAGTSYASVAANTIDGENWITTPDETINGCPTPSGPQSPTGIEVYGNGQRFYDNGVTNHDGIGIEVSGGLSASNLTFSTWNPWDSGDTYRCVTYTGWRGMAFLDGPYPATNVTLDDVCVTHTGNSHYPGNGWGIQIDDSITGTGFTNNACLNNNASGNITEPGGSVLTNTSPGNTTTCTYP